jgi:hypothetical protein
MCRVVFLWLVPLALAVVAISQGQTLKLAASPDPVELVISGPHVVHRGENLWFAAALTNRSAAMIAVPSPTSNISWWYMIEGGWSIADDKGRELKSKQAGEIRFDNMVSMPTFRDSDFVLLKPGEKIEYSHESLGDPSDRFFFPGDGSFDISLKWHFCSPTVKNMPNGAVAYTCGVTRLLSQPFREALLATPSFDVCSNVWRIHLK